VNPLTLGIVRLSGAGGTGLAAAAERHPGVVSRCVTVEDRPATDITGLVIDVPPIDRQAVVLQLARRWRVPFLLEAPVALTPDGVTEVERACGEAPVCSENPLRHHLPTRRLREQVVAAADPVEQVFAAWRFRQGGFDRGALAQLIDYLGHLVGSRVARATTMRRDRPAAFLVSLRYENDVVGSVEIGEHLPASLPWRSELLIECFCRERVYHCAPDTQAITVDGRRRASVDWSEPAFGHIISTFVEALAGGHAPERSLGSDLGALVICRAIVDVPDPAGPRAQS